MNTQQKSLPSNGGKLQVIGIVLMALSIFGVIPLLVNVLLKAILSNPAVNTTGLAIVNIGTLSSAVIGLIAGLSLALIGTRRKSKSTKRPLGV